MGDVRELLDGDLARHPAPPLDDLIAQAMVRGGRLRRRRRLAQFGAGGSALVMLLVIGLATGPLGNIGTGADDGGQPGGSFGSPGGGVPTAEGPLPTGTPGQATRGPGMAEGRRLTRRPGLPSNDFTRVVDTVEIGAKPDGELRTTTPQGALELLMRLLPKGKTSDYASLPSGAGAGMPFVQLTLDRGHGPGMLRLSVYQDELGDAPAPGTVELTEVPDNCVQNKMVTVHHGGGLQIDLLISTCRSSDGARNLPSPAALSVDEAVGIAANPIWGTKLPAEIVSAGAKQFPKLARSNG